tara:strand:+ start:625 stop:822 length:198 start_codon:yes stop_codon:yes gene_type:complete
LTGEIAFGGQQNDLLGSLCIFIQPLAKGSGSNMQLSVKGKVRPLPNDESGRKVLLNSVSRITGTP